VVPAGGPDLRAAETIPPPATARPEPSLAEQLDDLGRLHAAGVLTDDEFASAKRRLLDG
jgi:hypothetical protein